MSTARRRLFSCYLLCYLIRNLFYQRVELSLRLLKLCVNRVMGYKFKQLVYPCVYALDKLVVDLFLVGFLRKHHALDLIFTE